MTAAFRTLAAGHRAEIRDRGSRFVAEARPVADEDGVRAAVQAARDARPDATHQCWASRLAGPGGPLERAHDAGEPPGTAGPPILQAIRGADLLDVVVVVSRWFGGTRLGKGGLARAYREAARVALDGAPVRAEVPRVGGSIDAPVARDGEIRNLVARHGGVVTGADYDPPGRARLTLRIPAAAAAALADDVARLTGGASVLWVDAGAPSGPAAGLRRRGGKPPPRAR